MIYDTILFKHCSCTADNYIIKLHECIETFIGRLRKANFNDLDKIIENILDIMEHNELKNYNFEEYFLYLIDFLMENESFDYFDQIIMLLVKFSYVDSNYMDSPRYIDFFSFLFLVLDGSGRDSLNVLNLIINIYDNLRSTSLSHKATVTVMNNIDTLFKLRHSNVVLLLHNLIENEFDLDYIITIIHMIRKTFYINITYRGEDLEVVRAVNSMISHILHKMATKYDDESFKHLIIEIIDSTCKVNNFIITNHTLFPVTLLNSAIEYFIYAVNYTVISDTFVQNVLDILYCISSRETVTLIITILSGISLKSKDLSMKVSQVLSSVVSRINGYEHTKRFAYLLLVCSQNVDNHVYIVDESIIAFLTDTLSNEMDKEVTRWLLYTILNTTESKLLRNLNKEIICNAIGQFDDEIDDILQEILYIQNQSPKFRI